MRRLFASRGASAAAVGALVVLVAGGGYALASGSNKTITVCVSHKGGALYKAKKCAKHDKKLTWNKIGRTGPTGPKGDTGNTGSQGPGATSLVYNGTGSVTPTATSIGNLGPWTLSALCTQSGSNTGLTVNFSGPGFQADETAIFGSGVDSTGNSQAGAAFAVSGEVPGPFSNMTFGNTNSAPDQSTTSGQALLFPTGGSPLQVLLTFSSVGTTPPPGVTANTCHMSASIIPVSAPAAASRLGATGRLPGPLFGRR